MNLMQQLSSRVLPITCNYEITKYTTYSPADPQTNQEKSWTEPYKYQLQGGLGGAVHEVSKATFNRLTRHSFSLGSRSCTDPRFPPTQSENEPSKISSVSGEWCYDIRYEGQVHYRLDLPKVQNRVLIGGCFMGTWLASNGYLQSWQTLALALIGGLVAVPSRKAERVHHHLIGGLISAGCLGLAGISIGSTTTHLLGEIVGLETTKA